MENLVPGRELGHYRLVEKIGEGGMGVVWKATDTTLGRDVAIKVLPDVLADDPERLGRFEREAKLLASLNHPNVAVVHGLHTAAGVRFLAMELVPGDDLAQRLERGAMPVGEALDVARQLAEALDTAHEQGVIHRDLKPANIKWTDDGQVKVLDFGLAKAFDPDAVASGSAPTMSPTLTSGGTAAGVILGTAAYMSPEQARGYPVDKRADIWACASCANRRAAHGRRSVSRSLLPRGCCCVRCTSPPPRWRSHPTAIISSSVSWAPETATGCGCARWIRSHAPCRAPRTDLAPSGRPTAATSVSSRATSCGASTSKADRR